MVINDYTEQRSASLGINEYTEERRQRLEDALTLLERGKFVLGSGLLSHEVFGPTGRYQPHPGWTRVWAYLGELLLPLWQFAQDSPTGHESELRRFAGSEERAFFPWLDASLSAEPDVDVRGRRVLEGLAKVVQETWTDWTTKGAEAVLPDIPLTVEEHEASTRLLSVIRNGIVGPIARASGIEFDFDEGVGGSYPDDEAKFTWLALNARVPRNPVPAMILLSRRLERDLLPGAVLTTADTEEGRPSAAIDPTVGLPPRLARKFVDRQLLMDHKRKVEGQAYTGSGIEAPGTTELDREGVGYLMDSHSNASLLVLAPTASGKSRFAQIAIAKEVFEKKRQHRRTFGKVVVIAATKPLVAQFARELREVFAGTEAEPWEVLEGTQDHPQNDDRIRVARFDVAVVVPEKLAELMRNGMRIERTPLVVVDELQHLVEGASGLELEHVLIEVFHQPTPPRFVGLSASLSAGTQNLLQAWLASNLLRVQVLTVSARPVPLTVTTLDAERRIESRTHVPGDRRELKAPLVGLSAITEQVRGSAELKELANRYRVAIGLILEFLGDNVANGRFFETTPSVLLYVDSARTAEDLARIVRELLVSTLGVLPATSRRRDEALSVRFAGFHADPGASDPASAIRLLPPGRTRRDLISTLETGVGFHTSSLNAAGRSLVEEVFRRGYVRVLFATDTAGLGTTLPADIVINADLHTHDGDARLISRDALIQRLSRAGRLGRSRSLGQGFVIARRPSEDVRIDVHERMALVGRPDASDSEVLDTVATVEGLYAAYVRDWSARADYVRPADVAWFDQLVSHHFEAVPGRSIALRDVEAELDLLFDRSLAGVDGMPRPDADAVIRRLSDAGTIALSGETYQLTPVGRSATVNAVAVADGPIVERIATAAREGAGPFTLVYLACTSAQVSTSIDQIAFRPGDSSASGEEAMALVRSYIPGTAKPSSRPVLMRHFPDEVQDFVGNGREADELRRFVELPVRTIVDPEMAARLGAIWRAFHVYLRWTGIEFGRLENVLGRKDPRWWLEESALALLAEAAASVLGAASDLLGTDPDSLQFRDLGIFAEEVELGVPALLAPFLHLDHPAMDRERVLGMRRIVKEAGERWDGLTDLFDVYVDRFQTIPETRSQGWVPLPQDVVEEVRANLVAYDEGRRGAAYRVIDEIGAMPIPGVPGRRVRDELDRVGLGEGADVLEEMLRPFGLQAEVGPDGDRVTVLFPQDGERAPHMTTFVFPQRGEVIDGAMIDRVLGELTESDSAVIVAVDGATDGALTRDGFLQDSVTIIDPALLLELVARVYQRYAGASVDDEDEDVYGGLLSQDERRLDVVGAQDELGRLFLYSAPALSRNDLENRLAYRKAAAS